MRACKFVALCGLVVAQTASAQWFDPTIALKVRPPAPIQFPNPIQSAQQIQAIEAARARAERDRAEAQLIQEQRAALEDQRRRENAAPQSVAPAPAPSNPVIEKWLVAAQPRMHLYNDFDAVVFASDVPFTDKMIDLMSESKYAADLAYYLGKHKTEALAISNMTTLNASNALFSIEQRLFPATPKAVKKKR